MFRQGLSGCLPVFLIQINPQILRWEQFHQIRDPGAWSESPDQKGISQFRSRREKCEVIAIRQVPRNNFISVVQKAYCISPGQERDVGKDKRAKIADSKVK